MKAVWNDQIIAESDNTVIVEGNHYFPHESIKSEYFVKSETNSVCPWKGTASYYSIVVNEEENKDAAWFYPSTSELANNIKNYVAFWKGVKVEK